MKCYFVYDGKGDWFNCTAIMEDGWAFAGHLCSHPNFAPGDLYYGRPQRIEILKRMFPGIDFQFELISAVNLPKDILKLNQETD